MSVRDTIRDDPFARKVLQVLTISITFAMATPGLFVLHLLVQAGNLPELSEIIIDKIMPFFQTISGDVISIIVGAAPAVVAGVCYTSKGANYRLNKAGLACAIIAVIGLVSSVVGLTALRSEDVRLEQLGGENAILNLSASVEVAARSSVFYLAIFFGIGGARNDS